MIETLPKAGSFLFNCLFIVVPDFNADRGEEPTTLLGDEVRVHATAVITGVQEVVDVQTEGDWTQRIFATKIDDGTG